MATEDLSLEELKKIEDVKKYMSEEGLKRGTGRPFHGPVDDLVGSGGADSMAEEIKARQYGDALSGEVNGGSIDNVVASDGVSVVEAMIRGIRSSHAVSGGNDSAIKGNRESEILDGNVESTQSMVAMKRRAHAVSGGNDSGIRGNYESEILSGDIKSTEAMVAMQRRERPISGGHEIGTIRGTIEDMENPGNAGGDQWKASFDHVQYLDSVLKNPHQIDDKRFREAVRRGIQDNSIFARHFTPKLNSTLSEQVKLITDCPKDVESLQDVNERLSLKLYPNSAEINALDRDQVREMAKTNVEAYLNVYSRLIAELRVANAEINPSYVDIFGNKDNIFEAGKYVGPIKMPIPFSGIRSDKMPLELMGHAVGVINALKFDFKNPVNEYRGGVLGENTNPSDLPDIVRKLREESTAKSETKEDVSPVVAPVVEPVVEPTMESTTKQTAVTESTSKATVEHVAAE